jgi:hypothetical protein
MESALFFASREAPRLLHSGGAASKSTDRSEQADWRARLE